MDELVKMISEKAGIPEAQARQAAEAAVEFIKSKAPAPLAGQIDSLLEGGGGGLGGMVGGMFGR
ncbi:MAG: hypothetical protein ACPG8W_13605 [Candidatus Promineifilaceae bacterium]